MLDEKNVQNCMSIISYLPIKILFIELPLRVKSINLIPLTGITDSDLVLVGKFLKILQILYSVELIYEFLILQHL